MGRPRGLYYHGWNVIAVCILAQAIGTGLAASCFSLYLHDWSAAFHVKISQLALAMAAETVGASLIAPLVGAWADRYPARWLFGLGLAGISAFFIAVSFATEYWQLIALYGLVFPLPLCVGTSVTSNTLISRWFVRRMGLALGLCSLGMGASGALLPPLLTALLPTVGWRLIWRGAGLICLFVVLPIVVAVTRNRPDPERDGRDYLEDDAPDARPAGHGHAPAAAVGTIPWSAVFGRANFWLLLLAVIPALGAHIATIQNLAPYATAHGLSSSLTGMLMSLLFVCSLGSTLLLGLIADRFGSRTALAVVNIVTLAGCLVLALGSGLPAIALGVVLLGISGGVFTLLGVGVGAEFGAAGYGRAFGASLFFMPIPAFATAGLAKVQEITGSYSTGFIAMAAILVISSAVILFMRPRGDAVAAPVPKPVTP